MTLSTSLAVSLSLETHVQVAQRVSATERRGGTFDLQDSAQAWLIESGAVDIFLVTCDSSGSDGARAHVLRVEEGGALFGLGSFPETGFRLTAVPIPHTRCYRFAPRSLQWLDGSSEEVEVFDDQKLEDAQRRLDSWILRLVEAICDQPASSPAEFARPGRPIQAADSRKCLLARKGIIWVRQVSGSSYFQGQERVPLIASDALFPLTRGGWLLMEAGSRVECLESHGPIAENDDHGDSKDLETAYYAKLAGLACLHRNVLEALLAKHRRAEAQEQTRLAKKSLADRASLSSSLFQLGATLNESLSDKAVSPALANPLLQVCNTIARTQGIKLRAHPDLLRGIKLADPVNAIARASGIRVRRVALRGEWWRQNNGSLVAFRDADNAPIGLLQTGRSAYKLYDPGASEAPRPLTKEMAAQLNPFAFLLYRPFPGCAMNLFDILRFGSFGSAHDVVLILFMGIAAGLMGVITPFATSIIFNDLIPGAERTQLVQMAGFLGAIALSTALFSLTRSFAILRVEGKMDASIQAALWDRLLRLPASFFRSYSSGDLAQRSLGIAQIRRTLTGSVLTAVFSLIFSVFSFGLLFYYNLRLACLATALVGFAFVVSLSIGAVQVGWQRELFGVRGSISSLLLQLITGIAKFRVAAAESRAFMAWSRVFTRQKRLYTQIRSTTNILIIFSAVYPVLALAAIFLYNAKMMTQPNLQHLNTGDFIGFLTAFTQFLATALLVSSSTIAALSVVPLYERARPIFQSLPEVDEAKSDPGVLTGEIDISNIQFRYSDDTPPVLRGISISIKPGQFAAFVGVSGSGKSTLLRLLLGFETPQSGAVYYDGQDLSGLDTQALRRQLGVVLQNSRLISGDIFTNIVGSSQLTIDDAWAAARMAGLENDIKRMPMGMHTIISEGGGGISGGQRQRLMIARALVGKPRILIFDEATSALDNETQTIVSRSLEGLQTTRIVIAHRLSTIIHADRIYVLANGVIAQEGTYDQLLEQGGLFADLVRRQLA